MLMKFRTTVSLREQNARWAKENIRNLSAFVDESIQKEIEKQMGMRKIIDCPCGIELNEAILKKNGHKCPQCKRNYEGVF